MFLCKACQKEFSDPESYSDHLMEEEHQKNLQTDNLTDVSACVGNSFSLSCTVCNKKFTGNVSYEDHIKSKKHKRKLLGIDLMKRLQNESNECEMSGTESVCSETHTMDIGETTMLEFNNEESFVEINSVLKSDDFSFTCNICNSKCSGIVAYQQHLNGKKHEKKLKESVVIKQLKQKVEKMNESKALEMFQQNQNMCDLNNSTDLNTSLIRNISEACNEVDKDLNNYTYKSNDFSWCDVSKKNLLMEKNVLEIKEQNLSAEDVKIRNESVTANEKIQDDKDNGGSEVDTSLTQNAMDTLNNSLQFFNCDICKVNISGAIPYAQHMKGAKHKKELRKAELLKSSPAFNSGENGSYQQENSLQDSKISSITDYSAMLTSPILNSCVTQQPSPDICKENAFYCSVCNIICSGIIPFEDHMKSIKHIKKKAMLQKMHSHINQHQDFKIQNLNDVSCEENKTNLSVQTKPIELKPDGSLQFEEQKNDKYFSEASGGIATDNENEKIENVIGSNNCIFEDSQCSVAGNMPCISTANKSPGALANSLMMFNCSICHMTFTGEIPLEQHRQGMKHYKKMQQLQYYEKRGDHEGSSAVRNVNDNIPVPYNRLLQNNIDQNLNQRQYDIDTELSNHFSPLKIKDSLPNDDTHNTLENDSMISSVGSSIVVLNHP